MEGKTFFYDFMEGNGIGVLDDINLFQKHSSLSNPIHEHVLFP